MKGSDAEVEAASGVLDRECEESRVQQELRDHKEYNKAINAKNKES